MIKAMATRESSAQRGRRRGTAVQGRLLAELRQARVSADVSQREIAARLGWSQAEYWRMESGTTANIGLVDLAAVASLLGLEISAGLHPVGDAILDRGHQAVIARFQNLLGPSWRTFAEAPLPGIGDMRAWDLLLRIESQIVGVEAETRIRDVQMIVRKVRLRERDGGVDEILLVLGATRTNRRLVAELKGALGQRYNTPPQSILTSLREGIVVPGSGVLLI
jgi:transcriptional regulator with XRE-family HTH domain